MTCRNIISISTTTDRNSIVIFYVLLSNGRYQFLVVSQIIYQCHCRVWLQMFFKNMKFYRHKFFRTFSDSCFRVTFILRIINHMKIFLSYFPFPSSSFYKSVVGSIFCYTAGLRSWDVYWNLGNFLEFS